MWLSYSELDDDSPLTTAEMLRMSSVSSAVFIPRRTISSMALMRLFGSGSDIDNVDGDGEMKGAWVSVPISCRSRFIATLDRVVLVVVVSKMIAVDFVLSFSNRIVSRMAWPIFWCA